MKKIVILSFLLISMSKLAFTQDVIVTKDGDTIKSTIIEENSDIINFGYRVGKNFGFACSGSIYRNNISTMNIEDENGEKVTIDDAKWSYGYIGVEIRMNTVNGYQLQLYKQVWL